MSEIKDASLPEVSASASYTPASSSGSALGAFIGGLFNVIGASVAQKKAYEHDTEEKLWQMDMYKRQLADNRANWEMQNAYNEQMYNKYNSPSAMVEQYKQAGLNPALMYNGSGNVLQTSGSIAGATPSSAGITNNRRQTINNYQNTIAQLLNSADLMSRLAIQSQQLKNLRKEGYAMDSQTNSVNADTWLKLNRFYLDTGVKTDSFGLGPTGYEVLGGKESKYLTRDIEQFELQKKEIAQRMLLNALSPIMSDYALPKTRYYTTMFLNGKMTEEDYIKKLRNHYNVNTGEYGAKAFNQVLIPILQAIKLYKSL